MAIHRQAVHGGALQQKRHNLRFMEDARYQLAVFQVVGGERGFILREAPVDFIHALPRVVDGFAFAQQLLRHRLQRKR